MSLHQAKSVTVHNSAQFIRRMSMETFTVRLYTGSDQEYISIEADKSFTAEDVVKLAVSKLKLFNSREYELAEVLSTSGQLCKERRLQDSENPVRIQLLWPKFVNADNDQCQGLYTGYRFFIRKKNLENLNRTLIQKEISELTPIDTFLTAFLQQPTNNKEYTDLCNLPDLNEKTLLENVKSRFIKSNIYTYVGTILIAVNPFKFFPIYNPKYVKMYQKKRLGDLPPHIFAIADAAFYTMLRTKKNQCIVISGESGSGKTESTNLLLHHLTALSHKGLHGSGVEQTILGAGPVLEAFGNAKTVHNNNSSRFGKFIQVNYKENGMVHGAIVEKYLLEKSRIVSQASNERNYHVFYYLLEGADDLERKKLFLGNPKDYFYLRQSQMSDCNSLDEVDEVDEFSRLKQSMEMVGFSQVTQTRIFGVLSAVLHLGNVTFKKKGDQHHDESVTVTNPDEILIVSKLLMVKERTLLEALTQKKTTAGDETVVMTHRMEHAVATRDAMAKCLYGALFDWIVLKVNQALLAKRHNSEHQGNSIGVLDIFGFEDFRWNSFEQFCINYANEHLQYYFNQHIFKFEQEEYKKEGIQWKNIEFIDNTGCLELFSKRANGLFSLLDEECTFPGASNDTLLSKFHHHHSKGNVYYEAPQKKEMAFAVLHYAGKVKYHIKDFREKNSDQIRMDIVGNLKSSSLTFVRELMCVDPVAVLRWTIIKTLVKSVFAFIKAGKKFRQRGGVDPAVMQERKKASVYLMDELGTNLSPHHLSSSERRSFYSLLHENKYSKPFAMENLMEEDENAVDVDVSLHSQRDSANLCNSIDLYKGDEARVMRQATRVLMRNKSMKPKSKPQTMFSDIKTLKTIANRTIYIGGKVNSKQKPPSVSAQFQWSLSQLMSTLNQANPFFIRCIKSNAEKLPCIFDDVLVLRQLRYTGMLATVRIRQSGYNYRLTFEEFIQIYKILLPQGINSDASDICRFLENQKYMNQENYQIGKTKVFLRETEKLYLDECLHCDIMKRVVAIQRWMKTKIENNRFLQMRKNAIVIQKSILCHLARRHVEIVRESVITIQRYFRGAVVRWKYHHMRQSTICIQAHIKGHICRKRYRSLESKLRKQRDEQANYNQSTKSDEGVIRDYSENECKHKDSKDILDKLETEATSQKESISSWPPSSATTYSPQIKIESLSKRKDDILSVDAARVQNLKQIYTSPNDRDGRSSLGTPGRERASKMSPAPLAKQESFSDMGDEVDGRFYRDSPVKDKISSLSPDKIQPIEDVLKKRQNRRAPDVLNLKDGNQGPLNRVKKFVVSQESLRETKSYPSASSTGDLSFSGTLKRKMSFSSTLLKRTKSSIKLLRDLKSSRKKKDSSQDESDEDFDKHLQKTHIKFAVTPLSPKSPKDDNKLVFPSNEDIKRGHKKILNKSTHRVSDKDKENRPAEAGTNWTVSRTTQWQYPDEFVIKETYELQLLDTFISRKINGLSKECNDKVSQFDRVFIKCLKGFHDDLKSTLSVAMQKKNGCDMKYRDLFANFTTTMEATCREDNIAADFPNTLCINAFRGYLDEFRNSVNEKKKDFKAKKKPVRQKREKKKDIIEFQDHKFLQVQFGIPTFCELCSNIIWILEKGHVCQVCKYTCHKKCVFKSTDQCKGVQDANNENISGTRVFGAPLSSLVTKDDKLPLFMENMIMLIETHGLYTEGIYRKSGSAHKIKMLKTVLDSGITDINIEEYQVHVLTSTLKNFFRELPEPLLTFELYDEFLQAAEIRDDKEAVQVLFSQIEKMPKVNHDVFERLVFHLARVAYHEPSNKMSVNSLAIIFAPCLLRTNKTLQAQHMLLQVSRQQLCLEKILQEQLYKLKSILQDINTLEYAEKTTKDKLNVIRASKKSTEVAKNNNDAASSLSEANTWTKRELVLNSHLQALREEKVGLTSSLPVFDRHSSDDEMLSAEEIESTYETADDMEDPEGSVVFNLPGTISGQLVHLTKNRANVPWRRPPSKYHVQHLDITKECHPLYSENVNFEKMQEQYECDDKGTSVTTFDKVYTDIGILNKKPTTYVGDSNKVSAANMEQKVELYKKYNLSTQTRRLQENSEAKLLIHAINITDHYRKDSYELNKQKGSQFGTSQLKPKVITDNSEHTLNTLEYSSRQSLELEKPQTSIDHHLALTAGSSSWSRQSESMTQVSPPKIQCEIDETSLSYNYFLVEAQNDKDRAPSFENTNLFLLEIGNDSDEEIMV